jgi:hypothetical protein
MTQRHGRLMLSGVCIVLGGLLAACDGGPARPSATAAAVHPASGTDVAGDARATTLNQDHYAPIGSVGAQCASDRPVMRQANDKGGGSIQFAFNAPRGTSKAEIWVFKRINERGQPARYVLAHKFEVGDGNPLTYKSVYETREIVEEAHYSAMVRRLKCGSNIEAVGEFSDGKEFTVGTPYDPEVPNTKD